MNAEQYQMASDGLLAAVFAAKGLLVPTPLCNSALDSLGDLFLRMQSVLFWEWLSYFPTL